MKKLLSIAFILLFVSCQADLDEERLQACANGDQAACRELGKGLKPPAPPLPVLVLGAEEIKNMVFNKTCTVISIDITDEELADLGVTTSISVESMIGGTHLLDESSNSIGGQTGTEYTTMKKYGVSNLNVSVAYPLEGGDLETAATKHNFKVKKRLDGETVLFKADYKAYNDGRLVGMVHWMVYPGGYLMNPDIEIVLKCE